MKNLILALSLISPSFAHADIQFDYAKIIHDYEIEKRITVNEEAKAYIEEWDPCTEAQHCEFLVHGFLNYVTAVPGEATTEPEFTLLSQGGDYGVFTREEEIKKLISIPKPPKKPAHQPKETGKQKAVIPHSGCR